MQCRGGDHQPIDAITVSRRAEAEAGTEFLCGIVGGNMQADAALILRCFGQHLLEKMAANPLAGPPDQAGWIRCDFPFESIEYGVRDLLRLGAEVEVLGPAALREAMRETVSQIAGFYERKRSLFLKKSSAKNF